MQSLKRKWGWKPDTRPEPHIKFSLEPDLSTKFPAEFSHRHQLPPPYDQTTESACTGYSTARVLQFDRRKEGKPDFMPSPDFLYANGRPDDSVDDGAMIQDVLDAALVKGYCSNTTWPSGPSHVCRKPSAEAYAEGLHNIPKQKARVPQNERAIKHALFTQGFVLVCGIWVYSGMETDEAIHTGIVHVPSRHETFQGGHAICITGWSDKRRAWELGNSWGMVGDAGYFWFDYDYILDPKLSSDHTIIQYA